LPLPHVAARAAEIARFKTFGDSACPVLSRAYVSARYDRNRHPNPPPRLCSRQHLRPDARRAACAVARGGVRYSVGAAMISRVGP
jgi:hypothetical protein